MKYFFVLICTFFLFNASAQKNKFKERIPSYFGLQVRPVFPASFIGETVTRLEHNDPSSISFTSTMTQRIGYSFGATVRAGITKLIAFETGLNFTQRNFDISYSADSNIVAQNDLSYVNYDIPLNALFYIRLADKWYMNASLGFNLTFTPTDIGVYNNPRTVHYVDHRGLIGESWDKFGFDANANIGFEFRTEKSGFFYLGGSARVPFKPIFDLYVKHQYQGIISEGIIGVDGSFFSLDIKYFFPNIKNKGNQPLQGPVVQ